MKKILVAIIFTISFSSINAQEETFTVSIEISGMNSDTGNVFVALYNSEATFLKPAKAIKATIIPIKNKKATAYFKRLQKGEYAVSLFHDENNNKKMDTKMFGIPKEAYGFSNDAKGFMGPPKYKDAKFIVNSNKTITIVVK